MNKSLTDGYLKLSFGVIGYFMKRHGHHTGPVVLGIILSCLIDANWRRAIISEQDCGWAFFLKMMQSLRSLALFASPVLILLAQTPRWPKINGAFACKRG
jgi:putative tricarboxylic transport membrane protein